jgi:hypothetical protein
MRLQVPVACLVLLWLSACGGGATAAPEVRPSSPQANNQRVVAGATVIDHGDGPKLCLGAVQTSLPPGCIGVPLDGWTWPKGSESSGGTRWGTYAVVGGYDGKRFSVTKTLDEDEAARHVRLDTPSDFGTRCPAPQGGWRALKPRRATEEDQERTFTTAERLPGYGTAWIDDQGHSAQRSVNNVINVRVTTDVDGAARTLRRVWGGSLCVTKAKHTDSELRKVADSLMGRPGAISAGAGIDNVAFEVVYDDGHLQRQLDGVYGAGLVLVASALQPYSG